MTRRLAVELGPSGVRVVCLRPHAIADAAVFLASDRAAAITGAVIDLTCGNAVRNSASALVGVLG
jgi:NAD(P)-dependent dehydrogenase (short-subunit alcohol dehydrogenase family)